MKYLSYIIILFCLSTKAFALEKHALLVGISDYHVKPLAGPVFDVRAVRKTLIKKLGISARKNTGIAEQSGDKGKHIK